MVLVVFKCTINGTWVFQIFHKRYLFDLYPKWYLIAQNLLFRNQPDETIEAVNKKKKNELDQKTITTCPHVSQLHIHHFE
jgi:hypothetical protein